MTSLEHLKLKTEALKKFSSMLAAFNSYCNTLVMDKRDFDTQRELKDFENGAPEGLEFKAALDDLRKFEQENNI